MNKHADIHTDSYLVLRSPMTAVLQLLEKNLADHWKTCSRGMELKIGFKYIRNSAQESGDPEWRRHNLMHCTHGQLKIRVRRQSLALSSLFIFPPESASLLGFTPVISGSVWEPQKKNACGWLCLLLSSVQFSSVAQSCPTLCDPMNHSMPGLPVHHQFPESTQTHVHWVGDAIPPSHSLSSPSPPALNLSQHQGLFKWVSSLPPPQPPTKHSLSPPLPNRVELPVPPECLSSTGYDGAPSQSSLPNSAWKSKLPACHEAISSVASAGFSGNP